MPFKVKALQAFPCAVKEHEVEKVPEGAEFVLGRHFSKADVEGLEAAGLVKVLGEASDEEAAAAPKKSKAKG